MDCILYICTALRLCEQNKIKKEKTDALHINSDFTVVQKYCTPPDAFVPRLRTKLPPQSSNTLPTRAGRRERGGCVRQSVWFFGVCVCVCGRGGGVGMRYGEVYYSTVLYKPCIKLRMLTTLFRVFVQYIQYSISVLHARYAKNILCLHVLYCTYFTDFAGHPALRFSRS